MYDSNYLSLRLNMQAHRIRKSIRLTSQVIILLRWAAWTSNATQSPVLLSAGFNRAATGFAIEQRLKRR
jgi:hypothetical protein